MKDHYCLKMALHNLSESENNNKFLTYYSRQYYKGILVGLVSALMDNNKSFDQSLEIIKDNLPADCIDLTGVLPEGWPNPLTLNDDDWSKL